MSSPRLLQPISGDFTVSTLISFAPNSNYQSTGILLWQDPTTFLHLEIAYDLTHRGGVTLGDAHQYLSKLQQHPTALQPKSQYEV